MYSVFVRCRDGVFLQVASREELQQALNLIEELMATWPHEYVVRDSEGNDIEPSLATTGGDTERSNSVDSLR